MLLGVLLNPLTTDLPNNDQPTADYSPNNPPTHWPPTQGPNKDKSSKIFTLQNKITAGRMQNFTLVYYL